LLPSIEVLDFREAYGVAGESVNEILGDVQASSGKGNAAAF
jgi:hypothetical protein